MTDPLGLSVGTVNLVAAGTGRQPVSRRSVLTLLDRRPPEIGATEPIPAPGEHGMVMHGFVERVGDPTPLIAPDGSAHRAEDLLADALDAIAGVAGHGTPVWIAIPADWDAIRREALRTALMSKPGLTQRGGPPVLITDAEAAITALRSQPGLLPTSGVVALCDFGGSGTGITLVDASANMRVLTKTVRYQDFSGNQLDQDILNHALTRLGSSATAQPGETTAVESLTRLRDACRAAKERLSEQAETVIPVDLAGFSGDVPLTRGDLDNLVSSPLAGLARAIADILAQNTIPSSRLAAVAIVGGGANIAAVGTQLSQRLRVPVVTAPQPGFCAASGALTLAEQQSSTGRIGSTWDAPTSMSTTAWAPPGSAAGSESAAFGELAWSQEDSRAGEPVPYSGADYTGSGADYTGGTALPADSGAGAPDQPGPVPWYKRPVVLFGLAAALALAATGGLAFTLTGSNKPAGQTTSVSTPAQPSATDSQPPASPDTDASTAPDNSAPASEATTSPPAPDTTTPEPATTQPTTPPPTTTAAPSTTQPTTSAPPTTSEQPPSESTASPTTAAPEEPTRRRWWQPRPRNPNGGGFNG